MNKPALAAILAAFSAAALAEPETFTIDPSHTYPYFEYNHLGYSNQRHRFEKTSGSIVLDRAAKTATVDVSIDAESVATGSRLFDRVIQGPDFFDTARYPTITFKSNSVKFDGDKPVAIEGTLTIKGVTKPVSLTVTNFQSMPHPIMNKDTIGGNAVATIRRSEFDMGKYAPQVSDDVTLAIAIEAVKY
jgi:polyisoprenoid-binding protein YceI